MKKAFTLVELLIVIAILAVLSVVVFVVVNPGQRIADSQNARTKQNLQTVSSALELYFVDNGSFPSLEGGNELVDDHSSSSLPGTESCSLSPGGATLPVATLDEFITEDNEFFPDYANETIASQDDISLLYYSDADLVITCSLLADGTTYLYPEIDVPIDFVNLLDDGDMELANSSEWSPYAPGASLSKQTTNPRSGSRVLRVSSGTSSGGKWAFQNKILDDHTYTAIGYARSDGTVPPAVHVDGQGGPIWVGTTSTSWQQFSITFTHNYYSQSFRLGGASMSTGTYVEFDDVILYEVVE